MANLISKISSKVAEKADSGSLRFWQGSESQAMLMPISYSTLQALPSGESHLGLVLHCIADYYDE